MAKTKKADSTEATEVREDTQSAVNQVIPENFKISYDTAEGEDKDILDAIIAQAEETGFDNLDTAADFGAEMLQDVIDQLSEIDQEMMDSKEGVYADALSEFTESVVETGIGDIQGHATDAMKAGAKGFDKIKGMAKRNYKELGVAGLGAVAAPFTFGAGLAVSAAALGKMGYNEWSDSQSDAAKMAEIEARLAKAVSGIDPALDKIRDKVKEIPNYRRTLDEMRAVHEETLFGAAIHMAAGQEIQSRVQDQILSLEKSGDNPSQLKDLQEFAGMFDHKMVVLERTFASGAAGLVDIERRKKSMLNLQLTFDSILGSELAEIRSQAVQASVALEQFAFAKSASAFRDRMGQVRKDTREVTRMGEDAARDTRIDSAKVAKEFNEHIRGQITDYQRSRALDSEHSKAAQKERAETTKLAGQLLTEFHNANKAAPAKEVEEAQNKTKSKAPAKQRRRAGGGKKTFGAPKPR